MTHFKSSHESHRVAWTVRLGPVDPLACAALFGPPHVFWESRARHEVVAGYGACAVLEPEEGMPAERLLDAAARSLPGDWSGDLEVPQPPGVWFGGIGFTRKDPEDPRWAGFPGARFVLPERLVWSRDGEAYVTAFAESPGEARRLASLRARLAALPPPPPSGHEGPVFRLLADRAHWDALHARALAAFAQGRLGKVVLARAIDVACEGRLDPLAALQRLRTEGARGTAFAFRGSDGSTFLGLTPETLVRVSARRVETEALAGTAPAGAHEGLLEDERIAREHGAVVEGIQEALAPLCERVMVDARPALLHLRDVVHLRTRVVATLREGAAPSALVAALHPTPATGGTPREAALAFLAAHEGLARGWYAGALGWVGPEGMELVVGLRSALVRERDARLFVGAGVVAGSTAQAEWDETETKARPMLRALGVEVG
jgi:salicylate biosynthesis isochorismate synthase